MRKSYLSDRDFRKNRVIAIVVSLVLHFLVVGGLVYYHYQLGKTLLIGEELNFGSSGGGGAENANEGPPEFGAQQPTQDEPNVKYEKGIVNLVRIQIERPVSNVANPIPVPEKEKPKLVVRKLKPQKRIIAENLPIGHVRHYGQGPGSGGGQGGGSGGGIGGGHGYAIDWGGTGSRRLLSGNLPVYPKGTDKQMAVVLQFSVMPDGSVLAIRPARKSDELLEHAAIVALQTWRFDPLPGQVDQKTQLGKVTFNFTLQ